MRHALVALLVLLPAPRLLACPASGFALRNLVEQARDIVLGEVLELHDVSGTEVAEVAVARTLKGAPPARFFYPAGVVYAIDGSPGVGTRVVLFLIESDDFSATRPFWKELDRLRAGESFFDVALMGAFTFAEDGEALMVPSYLKLPETVPATLRNPERVVLGSLVDGAALIAEIEALVAERASPIE